MALRYVCAWCGENADASDLADAPIDAGTTLRCNVCTQLTVVDLFQPDERAALYGQKGEGARAAELDAAVMKFKASLDAGRHRED